MDSGIKYIEFEKKKLTLGLHVPNLTPLLVNMVDHCTSKKGIKELSSTNQDERLNQLSN